MIARIGMALQADKWTTESLPGGNYVLSKIWEHSPADLRFTRRAKPDEPAHWSFKQTVFVSDDAAVLALYCEVGW
jgi:hypothetical protein